MTAALQHNEKFRALQLYDRIPAVHIGVMVTKCDFEPHLRRSEIAVVDTGDKDPQFGELYVITLCEGTPREKLAIVQLIREAPYVGGVGYCYGFGLPGTGQMILGRRCRYVDGPISPEYWQEKCVGRIVGVMQPQWEGR